MAQLANEMLNSILTYTIWFIHANGGTSNWLTYSICTIHNIRCNIIHVKQKKLSTSLEQKVRDS